MINEFVNLGGLGRPYNDRNPVFFFHLPLYVVYGVRISMEVHHFLFCATMLSKNDSTYFIANCNDYLNKNIGGV